MAYADVSSDSEYILQETRKSPRSRGARRPVASKVQHLASALQASVGLDTNQNLRAVDRMLEDYRDIGEEQGAVLNTLKDDLARTSERLRNERLKRSLRDSRGLRVSDLDEDNHRDCRRKQPTSPLRGYESERELGDGRRRRGRSGSTVRFYDDMDADSHVHGLHQDIRDISSEQLRLEDDLSREINRRNKLDCENKKTLKLLADSTTQPFVETALSSVDKRLQDIQDELRSERRMLRRTNDDAGVLSSQLKQALQQQRPAAPSGDYTMRLTQSDPVTSGVQSEVEQMKRQLDHSERNKYALFSEVENLKKQLREAEEGHRNIKSHLPQRDDYLDKTNRQTDNWSQEQEREKKRLEEELRELRSQVSRSAVVVGDYSSIQKDLERSERQRAQLSDHIQVLTDELDKKDRHSARLINQTQDLLEKYTGTERLKEQAVSQLEEARRKLKEGKKQNDELKGSLGETKAQYEESERKREEVKIRALETVRQWKLKCKKLERDLDRIRHSASHVTERNEQLIKELEVARGQAHSGTQHVEHIKREFAELLAIRAQQDEQLRVKDVQLNELKSLKMDLEKDLRDCKAVIDKLEYELHTTQERGGALLEEKHRYEDQVASLQNAQMTLQSHIQQLQKEVTEHSVTKVELSAQLVDVANERKEAKEQLKEALRAEEFARDELNKVLKRVKEEKEIFGSRMEAMKAELEQYKVHGSNKVQEMCRHFKKEHAEYEAELQALKLTLQEERSAARLTKKQMELLKTELDRVNEEFARSQEESSDVLRHYDRAREEFLTKNVLNTVAAAVDSVIEIATIDSVETYKALSLTRGLPSEPHKWLAEVKSKLEWPKSDLVMPCDRSKLEWLKSDLVMLPCDRSKLEWLKSDLVMLPCDRSKLEWLKSDLVMLLCDRSKLEWLKSDLVMLPCHRSKLEWLKSDLVMLPCDRSKLEWLKSDLVMLPCDRSKLDWLKSDLREQRDKEQRLKMDVRDIVCTSEKDRQYLVAEIHRQNDVLDQLANQNLEFADRDVGQSTAVSNLKDQVEDLTNEMLREQRKKLAALSGELQNGFHDPLAVQETAREREKIQERYSKLQLAMNSLRDELANAKPFLHTYEGNGKNGSMSTSTPSRKQKKVRIASPPTLDGATPSPKRGLYADAHTPPLSLTDDEFASRFFPHDESVM
ncbi:hypothetical protein NP493_164g03016 [Ridgeia piscesae]|uniref:Uncharacterized protein n=1 Tax=Ridgeia piscesae TaxID=27915 RepID=A0AAD9P3I4_RIDPI|nr:hypothetical protein NP493_164g03016 [Ridgeia piscesae]